MLKEIYFMEPKCGPLARNWKNALMAHTPDCLCGLRISPGSHPKKAEIYGELPPISKSVAQKRARFAGHRFRSKDQVISDLLLWRLPCSRWGNRPLTYTDTLAMDTGLNLNELAQAMANRTLWHNIVSAISTAVD